MKRLISGAAVAALVTLGSVAFVAAPASAHTPKSWDTCSSISVDLTNYEVVEGSAAEYGTREVSPAIPAVPGTPAVPAVYGPTLYEYAHADNGNGNSDKTRWEVEGWNAGDNGKGWVPTGNTKPGELITPEIPAVAEIPAVPAVTEQYEIKPAVAGQDNTVTLELDGVVTDVIHFGTSYQGTKQIDGTKDHTYKIVIDAIGTRYDVTITGDTQACPVPIKEIPYPTLLANEVCGADNDTVYVDPAWVEQYGSLVAGPWIDTKYKTIDGKRVVDGSAQIKAEFRKTHIWAGTAGTSASDFRRWMMYPGTAPFTHQDVATDCPIPENPGPVVVTGEWTVGTYECGDTTVQITREVTSTEQVWNGKEYVDGESVTTTQTETRDLTDEEIAALDCTVVTPPTDTPDEETPVTPVTTPVVAQDVAPVKAATTDEDTLATTGGSADLGLLYGAAGLLAVGGVLVAARRHARR